MAGKAFIQLAQTDYNKIRMLADLTKMTTSPTYKNTVNNGTIYNFDISHILPLKLAAYRARQFAAIAMCLPYSILHRNDVIIGRCACITVWLHREIGAVKLVFP